MSSDLFTAKPHAPLAELMRPRTLDEVVGQAELLGPGKPLRLAFASRTPHSMILWGPPGVGKTTLARLMAQAFDAEFIALSAVFSGVKDIREAVQRAELTLAQSGRHTILFVDEVHRFNKAQQDAFLPYVEQGLVTFIGATTENPSFEVISALLVGRTPTIADESVCMECKRRGAVCVVVTSDQACLGPVTHAGCGALCPAYARGCYGCFGPRERPNTAALADALARRGMDRGGLVRTFRLFTGGAPAFRKESERHE